MAKEPLNKVKLSRMLRNGATQTECAKHFNVSPGRISQIRKELNVSVVKNVALNVLLLLFLSSISGKSSIVTYCISYMRY